MTVAFGTNAGFVGSQPSADPAGGSPVACNRSQMGQRDTSPAGTNQVIEIGWYTDTATEEANFEVGLYSWDADISKPNALIVSDKTNAKGTNGGWKRCTLSSPYGIDASTSYVPAFQLDNTATTTNLDRDTVTGDPGFCSTTSRDTLYDPTWGTEATVSTTRRAAIYALYEAAGGLAYNASGAISQSGAISRQLNLNRSYSGVL